MPRMMIVIKANYKVKMTSPMMMFVGTSAFKVYERKVKPTTSETKIKSAMT